VRNPIVGEMLLGKDCDKLVILGDYPNGEFSFFLGEFYSWGVQGQWIVIIP